MQAVVDNLMTTFSQTGNGKDIVILHGWGDTSQSMAPLAKLLVDSYRVTTVDLPGFGGTQAPDRVWGLDDYAAFVMHFLQKAGVKPQVIIGHSNGGAIAIRALSKGLKADNLVLVASAGIRGEYKGRMRLLRYATKTAKLATYPLPAHIKKRLRRKLYTTVGSDMLMAEHLQETFKKVVTDDVRKEASELQIPTLLIYGDKDVSTPLKFGRILHDAIQGSRLAVIPGGEHWLPTENTAEVHRLIKEFI